MSIKDFVIANTSSGNTSIGLLILRVFGGLSLFLKHGLEKLTEYSTIVQFFPDPGRRGAIKGLQF